MRSRSAVVALLAAGALVLGVACGDDGDSGDADTVSAASAETVVRDTLENGGFSSDQIEDLSCPSGQKREEGTTFECDAKVAGTEVKVKVAVQETDGRLAPATTQSVFDTGSVETDIETKYDEQEGVAVSASCSDDKIIKVDDGATFPCTVEDSNGTIQSITVTVDTAGAYSFDTPSFS